MTDEYIPFTLHKRECRYYNDDRIEIKFVGKTNSIWRPLTITPNHDGLYKKIMIRVGNKQISMLLHRVIYFVYNQKWDIYDSNLNNSIDHIKHEIGMPLDNSIGNLRLVSHQQNHFNRIAKGYSFNKQLKRYEAYICVNYRKIGLGFYDTADEAHNAYLEAKQIYHII
jgi:hypothetical protein